MVHIPKDDTPTIVDSVRGVREDFRRMGINLVSTMKSARHTAGHLGFRKNLSNVRRNLGLQDENVFHKIRGRISSDDTVIPRPGILLDEEGNPRLFKRKAEEMSPDEQGDRTQDSSRLVEPSEFPQQPTMGGSQYLTGLSGMDEPRTRRENRNQSPDPKRNTTVTLTGQY